jgi:hypothetical protein
MTDNQIKLACVTGLYDFNEEAREKIALLEKSVGYKTN